MTDFIQGRELPTGTIVQQIGMSADGQVVREPSDNTAQGGGDLTTVQVKKQLFGRSCMTQTTHSDVACASSTTGAIKANATWHTSLWLPCGIDSVRVGIMSDVADVSTYTNIFAGVQTSDASGAGSTLQNPYLSSELQSMVQCTFGGSSNPTFVAGTAALPSVIWSDWTPVNYTGSKPCYLLARVYYPTTVAAGGSVRGVTGRSAQLAALGANSLYGYSIANTTASSTAVTVTTTTASLPIVFQFATRHRLKSIAVYGDSTRQGWYATGTVSAYERYAIARTLSGTPTAITNKGYSGQTSSQFLARLKNDYANGDICDTLVWQVSSPNDSSGSVSSAQAITNTYEALRIARKMGANIILERPFPMAAGTPAASLVARLSAADALCSALSTWPGVVVADYTALHDPATYGKWCADYNYNSDGLHQNELATTDVIYPTIRDALNLSM